MLNRELLENNIRSIIDSEYVGFQGFKSTQAEAVDSWVLAIGDYGDGIIPPTDSQGLAKEALRSQLLLITNELANGLSQLVNGLTLYGNALAPGMATYSKGVLTGTPPAGPLTLFLLNTLGNNGASSKTIATYISTQFHTWMKTGIATNNITNATINWN